MNYQKGILYYNNGKKEWITGDFFRFLIYMESFPILRFMPYYIKQDLYFRR